ncbi:hypothetical protein [uncultured Nocardioides sp.]|uniref:Aminoglycoside phosphotransferase domain-containing protein n=1 Tax=uncultured Nocardioides sp. TaxID=198441 RepID=A0A6J4NWH3_9ACTN|nr:hypothetical protein [uncultured Nocardioides sp.]CAA9395697.1 MAG: hypothetical protein AVDCRST_MAG06-1882 [uncultured Nocardioides sp.]
MDQAIHFAADFPWRSEVALGDVVEAPRTWDVELFARAAHLLGRWNARSTSPAVLARSAFPAGYALRMYAERAVPARGLGPLADDGLWAHPWLACHADLRADLRRLGSCIPAMLDRLDTFVQAMPHGDASPQNLLVPADGPDGFVVIDISFRSPHALGFDLGQLLVGLTHAGHLPAAVLDELADRILPAYLDGLETEGLTGLRDDVAEAFALSVQLRSGFDAIPWEWLDDPVHERDVAERVALARCLVGRALAHVG